MYNIAICDDEPETCSEIETYIADYLYFFKTAICDGAF